MKQRLVSVEKFMEVSGFLYNLFSVIVMRITCMFVDIVEVANDLNAPEGYLVQARDGTEDSSEIIGTFLDRSIVQERNPTIPRNFKILQCGRSMNSTGELLDVSRSSISWSNTFAMCVVLSILLTIDVDPTEKCVVYHFFCAVYATVSKHAGDNLHTGHRWQLVYQPVTHLSIII